jgi:hypothetical protein
MDTAAEPARVDIGTPGSLDWAAGVKREMETIFNAPAPPLAVLQSAVDRSPEDQFLRSLTHMPLRSLGPVMGARSPDLLRSAALSQAIEQGAAKVAVQGDDAPTPNLSVGYKMQPDGGYNVQIRLQHPTVSALLQAKDLAAQYGVAGTVGIVRKLATHAGPYPGALGNNPLTLGSSVGVQGGYAGTLGAFAKDAEGRPGILSCSHILARGGAGTPGDVIFHPSPIDDTLDHRQVGRLDQFEDMRTPGVRPFDAAWALLDVAAAGGVNEIPSGQRLPAEGRRLGRELREPVPAFAGVAKVGRASAWTSGRIIAEDLGPLAIWFPGLNQYVMVEGMTEIAWAALDSPFSQEGDSGSLVFLEDTLQPIGLVVAGGTVTIDDKPSGCSYICPLAPILDRWGLTLL